MNGLSIPHGTKGDDRKTKMRFEKAIDFTMQWEGWISNDPDDPGGITKYGISLRFLRGVDKSLGDVDGDGDVDADDILALTPAKARELYRANFWEPLGLDHTHVLLALPLFDTAVNMGRRRAVTICQETICDLGHPVAVDGVMGPRTREGALAVLTTRHREIGDRFCLRRCEHYSAIAENNPRLGRYMRGWVKRTVALAEAIRKELW